MNWQRNKPLNTKYIYVRYTVQVFFANYVRSLEDRCVMTTHLHPFNLSQEKEKKMGVVDNCC
jgi:hypothetical protein